MRAAFTSTDTIRAMTSLKGANKEKDMAKTTTTPEYLHGIQKFTQRLSEDRARAAEAEGFVGTVGAAIETGRRYDKVNIITVPKSGRVKMELAFFVERETGRILGVKSPVAPNERHYFGTLDTARYWDWSGAPVPTDAEKAGVVEVGGYGEYRHFVTRDSEEGKAALKEQAEQEKELVEA
jgi:hypothetical protein